MEWSYHPLIEDKSQYPYKKEELNEIKNCLLISSSNTHIWKCISLKKILIKYTSNPSENAYNLECWNAQLLSIIKHL